LRYILNIAFVFFCPLLALSQFYLKGQVRDEAGNLLQNVSLYLHSTGYVYYSGSEGGFGITTNKKVDSITVSLDGFEKQKILVDATSFLDIRLKKSTALQNSRYNSLSSLTRNLTGDVQQQYSVEDESYASIIENKFIDATSYATTGLTLNVDRASYSNIRRFINMNTIVPPDAVRIEEMLNYFNFNYTEPSDNKIFGIKTILTDCPWNNKNQLLFAQITSRKIDLDKLPPANLIFLIDVSASMDIPNRLPLLKSGFKALVNNLRTKDSVAIVVYGGVTGIMLPTTSGSEKDKIFKAIDSLQASGSTPGESGIRLAYSVAHRHFIKGGNNRIILATDGDFNVGMKTEDELDKMISAERESGIYLTCLGVGMGDYKDSKIQTLAQRGNGNFAYLDSYAEAEKVLLKEFTQNLYAVADDASLSIQLDKDYVKEYRLLGFDNKAGAIKNKEATVEGGEIGSAYSTFIAVEIVPTEKALQARQNKISVQPAAFSVQYKLPGQPKTYQQTDDPVISFIPFANTDKYYQFASSVIMFGSLLRKSKFAKDISWNNILQIASSSADENNFSQKEFITLVQKAKTLYGKKKRRE
jgi:Ca-activated chloride channel family protein